MSIPADFRRVLESGDPNFPQNPTPRLVILYGSHLGGCLHAYTIEAMTEIEAGIMALKRGSKERHFASRMILGKSSEIEVDRDGRIVLPKERRIQIGLEGEVQMVAMGDFFEIWDAEKYAKEEDPKIESFLAEQEDGFDPMSLLDSA